MGRFLWVSNPGTTGPSTKEGRAIELEVEESSLMMEGVAGTSKL